MSSRVGTHYNKAQDNERPECGTCGSACRVQGFADKHPTPSNGNDVYFTKVQCINVNCPHRWWKCMDYTGSKGLDPAVYPRVMEQIPAPRQYLNTKHKRAKHMAASAPSDLLPLPSSQQLHSSSLAAECCANVHSLLFDQGQQPLPKTSKQAGKQAKRSKKEMAGSPDSVLLDLPALTATPDSRPAPPLHPPPLYAPPLCTPALYAPPLCAPPLCTPALYAPSLCAPPEEGPVLFPLSDAQDWSVSVPVPAQDPELAAEIAEPAEPAEPEYLRWFQ